MSTLNMKRHKRACSQYQSLELNSRVESADPHKLVAILYDALQQSMEILTLTINNTNSADRHRHADRARSILATLEGNLDFEIGGELAITLAKIYRSMRRELSTAVESQNADRLNSIAVGVTSLANSWNAIRR